MRAVLTNLSNELYKESRTLLNQSAARVGIKEIFSYDFQDIQSTAFYLKNQAILQEPTGLGYWLWKPYIILEAMEKLSENDIVIYADCGIEIIAEIHPLIKLCAEKSPVLLFGNCNDVNASWTKRDCFVLMDCDSEEYWYSPHCDAALCLFRKTASTIAFLKEWLHYGCNKNIITDLPNEGGKDNLPGFIEHRRDQSILSLLAQKYRLELYRMPSQFGNHYKSPELRVKDEFNCVNQFKQAPVKHYFVVPYYNSPYGQIINHHRSKTKQEFNEILPVKEERNNFGKFRQNIRQVLSQIKHASSK